MNPKDSSTLTLPDGGHCPACGGPLERTHRHLPDRVISLFRTVHRYRCLDMHCGWTGLLGRDHPSAPASRRWPMAASWFLLGAACALAGVQGVRMLRQHQADAARARLPVVSGAEAQSRATPAGQDFDGAPLPATDDRLRSNPSPLRLRQSCAWGVPGGNPYRGTVAQALAAAQLPAKVVREISEMAQRGWTHGQVVISREGIRTTDGKRDYGTTMPAMAFGDTLCFNTRVNFPAGHVEYAALYRASDDNGRTYHVMVPYVCQNATVLGEREEVPGDFVVPEPASWSLALLGLGALAWWRPRRRKEAAR